MRGPPETESLGPGNRAVSVCSGALGGGRLYVGSRIVRPAVVGVVDPFGGQVRQAFELAGDASGGLAVWGIETVDDGAVAFAGVCNEGALYRLDPAAEEATRVATLDEGAFVWDLAAPPDESVVYAATRTARPDAESRVFAYDRASGEVTDLGPAVDDEEYARSVAATADAVYVGVGSHAGLVAVDRRTGDRTPLLPPALSDATFVRELATTDGRIVAGVQAPEEEYLLLVSRTDRDDYRIVDVSDAGGADAVATVGETVYFCGDGLYRYDPAGDALDRLASFSAADLCVADGRLVGAGTTTHVHDPADGTVEAVDLEAAGLAAGTQQVHSLTHLDGAVYAGGSGRATAIDVRTAGRVDVPMPGEPKATTPAPGPDGATVLYAAIYPGASVARYDPATGETVTLAAIGHEQNRPRVVHYHPGTGRLFVGTRPAYGRHGGALATFDPAAERLVSVRRGVVADQSITALATAGDRLVLGSEVHGGLGTDPVADAARLAVLDVDSRASRWEATPVPGAAAVTGLVPVPGDDDALCGYTDGGELFVFDLATRSVRRRETVASGSGQLVTFDGRVYGATRDRLFEYDPASGDCATVLDGLGGDWHSTPGPAAGDGALYAVRGRDVVRVAVGPE